MDLSEVRAAADRAVKALRDAEKAREQDALDMLTEEMASRAMDALDRMRKAQTEYNSVCAFHDFAHRVCAKAKMEPMDGARPSRCEHTQRCAWVDSYGKLLPQFSKAGWTQDRCCHCDECYGPVHAPGVTEFDAVKCAHDW